LEQKGLGKNGNGNGQPFFDIRVKLFGTTAEHFQVLKGGGLSNNTEEIPHVTKTIAPKCK